MLTLFPSRRRIVVLLGLLVGLPSGIVAAFALAGTALALVRFASGAGHVALQDLAWRAGVGGACLLVTMLAIAAIARQFERPDAPVTMRSAADPNPPRIRSTSRDVARIHTVVTVVWMGAWVAAAVAVVVRNRDRPGEWLWPVGLALLAAVVVPPIWRMVSTYGRTPDAWLEMDPREPVRGAPVALRFIFDSAPPPGACRITLALLESSLARAQRPGGGWERAPSVVWSASTEATPRGLELECAVVPPRNRPASSDAGETSYSWELQLHYPGEPVPRRFEIAVR